MQDCQNMKKTEQSADAPSVSRRLVLATDAAEYTIAKAEAYLPEWMHIPPWVMSEVEGLCARIVRIVAEEIAPVAGWAHDDRE